MSQLTRQQHWEQIYTKSDPDSVSWFQSNPSISLELLEKAGLNPNSSVIDVGGGASSLVDALLERGMNMTVLDISAAALHHSQERLGTRAAQVNWLVADITKVQFKPREFDVWHDRAVFHFLTTPEDRSSYVRNLRLALKLGGYLILGTFAPDGPEKCSGLRVQNYDTAAMLEVLGDGFVLVEKKRETHLTPTGVEQKFAFGLFKFQPNLA